MMVSWTIYSEFIIVVYKRTNLDNRSLVDHLSHSNLACLPTTGGPMMLEMVTTLAHSSSDQCTSK